MQRDDRGHGGEAHLEAGSGDRLRAEQQHHQRADRDQPQADRIAAERNPAEDKQGRDAAAHGRHLRPGQQGVADPGQRAATPAATSTRLKRSASRSLSASSLQGEQHRPRDHRGDVQAADRQQMRQAGPAHGFGIVLVDRILVAGGERGGDAAAAFPAVGCAIWWPSRSRTPSSPPPGRRCTTLIGPIALADRRRSPGTRHRAQNHGCPAAPSAAAAEPRAEPDDRARGEALRAPRPSSMDTRTRGGRAGIERSQRQAHVAPGGEMLDPLDPRRRTRTTTRTRQAAAARPTRSRTRPARSRAPSPSANQPSARPARPAPQREAGQRQRRRRGTGMPAHCRGPASANQAAMPAAEADHRPTAEVARAPPRGSFSSCSRSAEMRDVQKRRAAVAEAHPLC